MLRVRWLPVTLGSLVLVSASSLGGYRLWPQQLSLSPLPRLPVWELVDGRQVIRYPGATLLADVQTFRDELLAYLYFEYFRSLEDPRPEQVLLTAQEHEGEPLYRISFHLTDDLAESQALLAQLAAGRYIPGYDLRAVPPETVRLRQRQTEVFLAAYRLPVRRKLESLERTQLLGPMERFILFKARTDNRIRRRLDPMPPELSRDEARQLAADIIAVAEFYELPLDFFLGIGAMENNYMNVHGDLTHAVWKRRAQPGDVVLKRRKGRVLVLNYATGVWQITRETLRYAHRQFLKDERDYTLLPERLRPPRELQLDSIDPAVLTTYAGLLLRDLLDRFEGDVPTAVGAYNGGPGNPNMRYGEGVRLVADYARQILEQAAALNGQAVAETRFLSPAR
jgi:hypothetical protein